MVHTWKRRVSEELQKEEDLTGEGQTPKINRDGHGQWEQITRAGNEEELCLQRIWKPQSTESLMWWFLLTIYLFSLYLNGRPRERKRNGKIFHLSTHSFNAPRVKNPIQVLFVGGRDLIPWADTWCFPGDTLAGLEVGVWIDISCGHPKHPPLPVVILNHAWATIVHPRGSDCCPTPSGFILGCMYLGLRCSRCWSVTVKMSAPPPVFSLTLQWWRYLETQTRKISFFLLL